MRRKLSRGFKVLVTAGAIIFAAGGLASANTLSTAGPHSAVTFTGTHNANCSVQNNNNVSVKNQVNQHAESGDANVGGWGNWSSWDPESWHKQGHSYEDWYNAMSGYMQQMKHQWAHGGGNTSAGSAVTGAATNNNSAAFNVAIHNDTPNCFGFPAATNQPGGQGSGGMHSPTHHAGVHNVLGINNQHGMDGYGAQHSSVHHVAPHTSSTSTHHPSGSAAGVGGYGASHHVPAPTPHVVPTHSGGSGSGTGVAPTHISTEGPYSHVYYDSETNHNTAKVNNNNVIVQNSTNQAAESGDANVAGNTSAGSATTGPATNNNSVIMNLMVHND